MKNTDIDMHRRICMIRRQVCGLGGLCQPTCEDLTENPSMRLTHQGRLGCRHRHCGTTSTHRLIPFDKRASKHPVIAKIPRDTVRYDLIRYDRVRYDTIRNGMIQYDTEGYDTIRYNTIRYYTAPSYPRSLWELSLVLTTANTGEINPRSISFKPEN